jgi:hypothetical protein
MDKGPQFPDELFHGTNAQLSEGDLVEPRGGAAWATDDPVWAGVFSREAIMLNPDAGETASVYRVTPEDASDVKKHNYGPKRSAYSSGKGFRIVGRHKKADEDGS